MPTKEITIASRFCGPPESGNGGFCCGLLANALGGQAEVTLMRPPPLDTAMVIEIGEQGASLRDGDNVIAEAKPTSVEVDVPTPPSFADALRLQPLYTGFHTHPFATCFVCGPKRAEGDGLRIFAAKESPDAPAVAAWKPAASICDEGGLVLPEIVWAALDCPGFFGVAEPDETAVLGRMSAVVHNRPKQDEKCVLLAWPIKRDGRKLHAATALFGQDGELYAAARQTWIRLATA